MRRLLGWLGFVSFPVFGLLYYAALRLRNRHMGHKVTREFDGQTYRVLVKSNAKWIKKGAITFPPHWERDCDLVVFTTYPFETFRRGGQPPSVLYTHEMGHGKQIRRYGAFGYYSRYGREQALRGYKGNLLEVEARVRAGQAV